MTRRDAALPPAPKLRTLGAAAAIVLLLAPPGGPVAQGAGTGGPTALAEGAGGVRLSVAADRGSLRLDDRLRLTVRVEAPTGTVVEFSDPADELGRFAVVGREAAEPRPGPPGVTVWERAFVLQPEDVGALALPGPAVTYRGASGVPGTGRLAAEPLSVTVASVLPEGSTLPEPKGIGPPLPLPPARWASAWGWVAAALLGLLAIGLVWWRWRRRARLPEAADGVRPAGLATLDELDSLGRADLAGQGRTEEHYIRLSGILRHYIVRRFGVNAPTRTTEELLANFAELDGDAGAHRDAIGGLMVDCDLVKFAREWPSHDDAREALGRARDLVERAGDPTPMPSER